MKKRYKDLEKYLLKNFQLIGNGSNRIIFKNENKIFKLAKNQLGLDSNMNELILQDKSEYFNNTKSIERNLLTESDFLDLSKCQKVCEFYNVPQNEFLLSLEINYFLHGGRCEKRGFHKSRFENLTIPDRIKRCEYFHTISDLCIKYDLECSDILKSSYILDNKLFIFDFGLTEENYFNNMRRIVISTPIVAMNTFLYKDFSGDFVIDNEDYFLPVDFDSFCKFFIGEKDKISNNKFYNLNNIAFFNLTDMIVDGVKVFKDYLPNTEEI
jgi:hypothetical protein